MHRTLPVLILALLAAPVTVPAQTVPGYEVTAVRFATLAAYPVSSLVAGAERGRTMDLAMMVWLIRGNGRTVVVDAGFYRDALMQRWTPIAYIRPSEALAAAGVKPEDVTDVLVTHVHWDHMDGVDLFPRARVWIQREEYEHHVGDNGTAKAGAVNADDAKMLAGIRAAGRLAFVEGDGREILPGLTAYTGGKHTYQSQFFGVRLASGGTAVIASDNLYLYENLDRRAAIAQTLDATSNLAAQDRMRSIASDPRLIVPGHDPAVFLRFPDPGNGLARIR